jgi:hypothetical protein
MAASSLPTQQWMAIWRHHLGASLRRPGGAGEVVDWPSTT